VGRELRHLFSLDTDERGAVFLFRKQLMVSKILREFYEDPPQMGSLDDTGRNDGGDRTSTAESSDTPPPPPPLPSTRRTQVTKRSSADQREFTRKADSSSKGGTKSTSGTRPSDASTEDLWHWTEQHVPWVIRWCSVPRLPCHVTACTR
jgi:hypothetical protein